MSKNRGWLIKTSKVGLHYPRARALTVEAVLAGHNTPLLTQ